MIEKGRIYVSFSLFLITTTLILHLVAMGYPRWKRYDCRTSHNQSLFIGIFQRCENRYLLNELNIKTETSFVCNDNKYCFKGNEICSSLQNETYTNSLPKMQGYCNLDNNPYHCSYSSITKGLISCTIIAACTLGISLLLIFLHILINQFKYKIHIYITVITIIFLFIGFIFILVTLILLGSTMAYDLHQYRYNLDYSVNSASNITDQAAKAYDIRLDWASVLEILALIFSTFTIVSQIIYLISIHRNRIG